MDKPNTVPNNAIWDSEEHEWQLGEKNSENTPIGEWMYWTEDGHPCCKAVYDDNGNVVSDEHFPRSGFTCVSRVEDRGDFSGYNFYDQKGELLTLSPLLKPYEEGQSGETADAAIRRYKKVISVIKECSYIDHSYLEEEDFFEAHDIYFYKKPQSTEIAKLEDDLKIKFPPSYKTFILKHGFLIFGQSNDYNGKLFLDCVRMSDELNEQWGIDAETTFSKEAKQRLDNIFAFSYGDEGLQSVWYYCFDFNTLNPDTGETSVVSFDQDDSYSLAHSTEDMCTTNGFDDHMRKMVDLQIRELVDMLEREGFG